MKNLWRRITPLPADTFGLAAMLEGTDGMGLIDDSGEYKDKSGRRGDHDCRRGREHHGDAGNDVGGRAGYEWFVASNLRQADVISGSREKLLACFRERIAPKNPAFVLLCSAPGASMIGTDYAEIVEAIRQESQIPAAFVNVSGHKYYDNGLSHGWDAIAGLFAKEGAKKRRTGISLIGANPFDWGKKNTQAVRGWAENCGFEVCADFGCASADTGERAAEARVQLAMSASALCGANRIAKETGGTVLAAAPFGKTWSGQVADAVGRALGNIGNDNAEALEEGAAMPDLQVVSDSERSVLVVPQALFIGEQLMGNAVRNTLALDYGLYGTQVVSFTAMKKAYQQPGDRRLKSEEELAALLQNFQGKIVLAQEEYRPLCPKSCTFIPIPFWKEWEEKPDLSFIGEGLNRYLDRYL